MISYKKLRTPDAQYKNTLHHILMNGVPEPSPQNYAALTIFGHQMRFDLSNGFPMISERDLYTGNNSVFNQAISELVGFLNGVQTQEGLEKLGCRWWKDWTSKEYMERTGLNLEPGDLGPGSYPGAWTRFPMPDGNSFNQIKGLIQQIKKLPYCRRHFVSPWIPYYTYMGQDDTKPMVAVAPCHGWFHVRVFTSIGKLSLHHFQRSADAPVGLAANLIQYAALTLMLAQVLGYKAWELVYTISDMHMYISEDPEKDQRPAVENMLVTESQSFPKVFLNLKVKDIFEFRPENFRVEEYKPQLPRQRIWTPI